MTRILPLAESATSPSADDGVTAEELPTRNLLTDARASESSVHYARVQCTYTGEADMGSSADTSDVPASRMGAGGSPALSEAMPDAVLQQMADANFGDRPISLVPTDSAWRRVGLVKAWCSAEPLLTVEELAEHVRAAALVTRGRR